MSLNVTEKNKFEAFLVCLLLSMYSQCFSCVLRAGGLSRLFSVAQPISVRINIATRKPEAQLEKSALIKTGDVTRR